MSAPLRHPLILLHCEPHSLLRAPLPLPTRSPAKWLRLSLHSSSTSVMIKLGSNRRQVAPRWSAWLRKQSPLLRIVAAAMCLWSSHRHFVPNQWSPPWSHQYLISDCSGRRKKRSAQSQPKPLSCLPLRYHRNRTVKLLAPLSCLHSRGACPRASAPSSKSLWTSRRPD